MPANLENSAVATGLEKVIFLSNPKERQCQNYSNYHTIACVSHARKLMLKIFQAKLQQYVNWKLLDVQAGFRRGRGTRNQFVYIHWIIEKGSSRITSTSLSLTTLKPLTVWITTNCGKFLVPDHLTCLLRNHMQVKNQQLELNMEQQTCSKSGKEYVKAVFCHPGYLTYKQSTSCKMPGWMKYKLESRLPGEISITSDTQRTPPLWQKAKRN